jgi:protocatechuate 3,4-dioxygenase beta subunit
MNNDDALIGRVHSRREALRLFGVTGASALLSGCGSDTSVFAFFNPGGVSFIGLSINNDSSNAGCLATPAFTEGPFFVDERINRSDIRSDTHTGNVSPGVPLSIRFDVAQLRGGESSCVPLAGAVIDVWHCDALGIYSDIGAQGTAGQDFLRGFQLTDANGRADFITIYPGWYQGRAVHIHFTVRTDPASELGRQLTSQLFFAEKITDSVHAQAPYNQKVRRDTLNAQDGIFQRGGSQTILQVVPDALTSGYTGTFNVTLRI